MAVQAGDGDQLKKKKSLNKYLEFSKVLSVTQM